MELPGHAAEGWRRRPRLFAVPRGEGPDLAWSASGLAGSPGASATSPGARQPSVLIPERASPLRLGWGTAPGSSCQPTDHDLPQPGSLGLSRAGSWAVSPVGSPEKQLCLLGWCWPPVENKGGSDQAASALAGGHWWRWEPGAWGPAHPSNRLRSSSRNRSVEAEWNPGQYIPE